MKKILLILVIALIGCSKDELTQERQEIIQDTECECFEQTWVRKSFDGNITQDWYWNGFEIEYSNDCEDNGLVTGGYSGDINGLYTEIEYRVVCY